MPFVIWGTRGVTLGAGTGEFSCPRCNVTRPYKHKKVSRFFTLYFIPLIPMGKLGEYIECQTCRGTFQTSVLHYDPAGAKQQFEAEFQGAVKRVLVQMLLADGVVDDQEVESVQKIYNQLAKENMSVDDVHAQIEQVRSDGRSLEQVLPSLSGSLNNEGKELVIRAAIFVAAADGKLQNEEIDLLNSIGKWLNMTPAHVKGVFESVLTKQ